MSDWREISGDQNLRMAQMLLDKQGEINQLTGQLDRQRLLLTDPPAELMEQLAQSAHLILSANLRGEDALDVVRRLIRALGPIILHDGQSGAATPAVGHDYLSTACEHRNHLQCRRVCKFCPASCGCACHYTQSDPMTVYRQVWQPIIEPGGVFDRDRAARELHDHLAAMGVINRLYENYVADPDEFAEVNLDIAVEQISAAVERVYAEVYADRLCEQADETGDLSWKNTFIMLAEQWSPGAWERYVRGQETIAKIRAMMSEEAEPPSPTPGEPTPQPDDPATTESTVDSDVAGSAIPGPSVDARDLSCQALAVNVDPDVLTFHGVPVEGYAEEMARRGEWHVYGCELIGCCGQDVKAFGSNVDEEAKS